MGKSQRRPRLITIDDTSAPPPLSMMLYAHSKAGKTMLCGSTSDVPEMMPALYVDCGTSSASLQGEPRFAALHMMRILEFDGISEVHTWLDPRGGNNLEVNGYKTIIIDEMDQLHRKALNKIMTRNLKDGDRHGKTRANMTDLWLEDFGEARDMVLNVVEAFLKFNVNLLVTSLVRISEDELDSREYRMPSLAGQLRDDIPSRMAVYVYLDVQTPSRDAADPSAQGRRIAYFTTTRRFKAGVWGPSRAERFGAEIVDPTMRKIYDCYVGG